MEKEPCSVVLKNKIQLSTFEDLDWLCHLAIQESGLASRRALGGVVGNGRVGQGWGKGAL